MVSPLFTLGQVFDAVDNFEKFYSLSKDKPDFDMDDGRQMHPLACIHLCRIYTTIAKQYESTGNLTQYLSYLQKAYDHAKEGEILSLPVEIFSGIHINFFD